MVFLYKFFKNKKAIIIFFILYDLIFFLPLFFPKIRMLITPEFGGGDTLVIYYPFFKFASERLKNLSIPFWSKNIGLGYPLYAEGQIGFFNPINLFTNFLFDYQLAFNLQILIYILIAQIGSLYLIDELKLKRFTGIYLGIVFPFVPVLIMNFMQPVLIYPVYFLPFLIYRLIFLIKKLDLINFLLFVIFLFLQLLISHYQTFFMSFVFLLTFTILYLFLLRKSNKEKIKFIFIFILAYIAVFLFGAFQTFPAFEFLINSDRFTGNIAQIYDQNFTFKHLLTLFNPYFFGDAKAGTYDFSLAHPWESILFIYYLPLIFFIIVFAYFKKIKKNKFFIPLIISLLLMLFLTLGKNSPLYFIFSFPIFSSFKFPSRFIFTSIYILILVTGFGFDYLLTKFNNQKLKQIFFIACLVIIYIESHYYFYRFHILKDSNNLYSPSKIVEYLIRQTNNRVFTIPSSINLYNNKYLEHGYSSQSIFYYSYVNWLLLGNISSIYGIPTLNTKLGPYLKRFPLYYSLLLDDYNDKRKIASLSSQMSNTLNVAGIDYLLSPYPIKTPGNKIILIKAYVDKKNNFKIFLYHNTSSKGRFQFFGDYKLIYTLSDFVNQMSQDNSSNIALIEDEIILSKVKNSQKNKDSDYHYKVIIDKDNQIKLSTTTKEVALFVLADNFYPGWQAYIDGIKTPIYKTNLIFRGIVLPKGKHLIEFKFEPKSFYYGLLTSGILLIFMMFIIAKRKFK